MSYTTSLVYNVFLVTWRVPQRGDSAAILNELRGVHEGRKPDDPPLVYIATVPSASAPPDDATRDEMTKAIPLTLEYCARVYLVIEGKGLRHAMIRSIATGMFLITGKRGKVSAYATLFDALVAAPLSAPAKVVLLAAQKAGHGVSPEV